MSEDVVTVKMRNKGEHKISVCFKEDTVLDLKRKIYSFSKLLPKNQKFFFETKSSREKHHLFDTDSTLLSAFGSSFESRVSLSGTNGDGEEDYKENKVAMDTKLKLLPADAKCETPKNDRKLERFVREFEKSKIMMQDGFRKGKPLIIIDGDYVVYNNKPKVKPECKKLLNDFLSTVYLKYDIVLWTESSLHHLKSKMKHLGIPDSTYKFAALLDLSAMLSIEYSSSKFLECKPLRLIWNLFPECNQAGTIMLECRESYLAMNPKNGILTEPLNQLTPEDFGDLLTYLVEVAEDKSSTCRDHRIWRLYWTEWRGWQHYKDKMFNMPPFVFILEQINEKEALCRMGDEEKYIISRINEEYHPLVQVLHHSKDNYLLKVYHVDCDKKNSKVFFVAELHRPFLEWMEENQPTIDRKNQSIDKVKLDNNRFIVPFRSLLNSTISTLISTGKDFELDDNNVLVLDKDGNARLVVGMVQLQEPRGSLKCLKSLGRIVERWFDHHECAIPSVLSQLILLMDSWDFTKYGVDKKNSLRMIRNHPLFCQANTKLFFDFVTDFDSEIKNDQALIGHDSFLVSAFHDLGCKNVTGDTIWYKYNSKCTHPVLDECIKGGTLECKVSFLIRIVRNIAAHLYQYAGTLPAPNVNSKLPPVKPVDPAEIWNEVYNSMDVMSPALFSAIHLCCIKMGQSYRFVNRM